MKITSEVIIASAIGAAIYYFAKKNANLVNPFSQQNIVNQGAESLYKTVTGSTQSPGADIADAVYKNASGGDLYTLVNFFYQKGVSDTSKQQALQMGWTPTDIDRATQTVNDSYGPSIDTLPPDF